MITDEPDPVTDAIASICLFKKYYNNCSLQQARKKLLRIRPAPSWVKQNDYRWEGVCLAAYMPKKCFCGAPNLKK